MSISSVHIDISGFLYETKDLNEFNAWEWFKSFRDTLAYQRHEKEPNDYALALLEETENYSAYCAVAAIEGAAIATLENRGEIPTKETVYDFLADKKGDDYLRLKEREAAYLRTNPNAKTVWSRRANRINKSESTTSRTDNRNTATSTDQGNGQYTQPTPQQGKTEAPPQQKHLDTKKPGDLVYGSCENVFLTQDEFNKIAMDVGNLKEANSLVEDLSLNLADGKIESSNHFATLQKWAKWRKNHPNDERLETFHERDDRNQIETLRKVFSM